MSPRHPWVTGAGILVRYGHVGHVIRKIRALLRNSNSIMFREWERRFYREKANRHERELLEAIS